MKFSTQEFSLSDADLKRFKRQSPQFAINLLSSHNCCRRLQEINTKSINAIDGFVDLWICGFMDLWILWLVWAAEYSSLHYKLPKSIWGGRRKYLRDQQEGTEFALETMEINQFSENPLRFTDNFRSSLAICFTYLIAWSDFRSKEISTTLLPAFLLKKLWVFAGNRTLLNMVFSVSCLFSFN